MFILLHYCLHARHPDILEIYLQLLKIVIISVPVVPYSVPLPYLNPPLTSEEHFVLKIPTHCCLHPLKNKISLFFCLLFTFWLGKYFYSRCLTNFRDIIISKETNLNCLLTHLTFHWQGRRLTKNSHIHYFRCKTHSRHCHSSHIFILVRP